jgi:uncharacterized protein YegP (UPF0339 family)
MIFFSLKIPAAVVESPLGQIAAGLYRFWLVDFDGGIIAFCKGYFSKQVCLSDIAAIKGQAPDAKIEDRIVYSTEK